MTALPEEVLVDSSVLLSFFRQDAGALQPAADRLLDAIAGGTTSMLLLDLAVYEIANVLVRRLAVPSDEAAEVLALLFELADQVVRVDLPLAARAVEVATTSGLSAYDAAFVATGEAVAALTVTLDDQLAVAGAVHLRDLAG